MTEEENQKLVAQGIEKASELIRTKQYLPARILLTQGIKAFPEVDAFHGLLGLVANAEGQHDEALGHFQKALEFSPTAPANHNNLGLAWEAKGDNGKAESAYLRAIYYGPKYPPVYSNLAMLQRKQEKFADALKTMQTVLGFKREAYLLFNTANLLGDMGRVDEGVKLHREAVAQCPDVPQYHFNLSVGLLLLGEWKEGFEEFAWRRGVWPRYQIKREALSKLAPEWTGQPLKGKRLYLYCTQGEGDKLQFARFAKPLADLGAKVIIEGTPNLEPIFRTIDGVYQVATQQNTYVVGPNEVPVDCSLDHGRLPAFDYHVETMELPALLKITPENVPNGPYIKAEPSTILDHRKKNIGIVWAGNPAHNHDAQRSCRLAMFEPLADLPGVQLVSLQKDKRPRVWPGIGTVDLAEAPLSFTKKIIDLAERFNDFADTACLIAELDLVVTVDTSVAHLSAAMGKKTFIMLPFAPDWRWGLKSETTPWYPSARLFRQSRWGDYKPVIKNICKAIHKETAFLQKRN